MKVPYFFITIAIVLFLSFFIVTHDVVYSKSIQLGSKDSDIQTIWNPYIAEYINEQTIQLIVEGQTILPDTGSIYMNDQLKLMLPLSLLRDYLYCSVNLYDNNRIEIQQYETLAKFVINETYMWVDVKRYELSTPLVRKEDQIYIAADDIKQAFGCDYSWSMETNSAVIHLTAENKKLPSRYDYRNVMRDPVVKDQGRFGTCWAFASLTALESSLLPKEAADYSEDHMTMNNSFSFAQNDGGEYTMAMAYLTSWQGPVLEEEDPYGDAVSPNDLMPAKHLQEVQVVGAKDMEEIKKMVFQYGGVQSSLYTSLKNSRSYSEFYNPKTYAYCYSGKEKFNHDVVIIGWDDNYPKENFSVEVEADGAFICRNSWGEEFGDQGTFYVSYYDSNIGVHNVVFTKIEEITNYDTIYQSDLCGWVGQLGYGREQAYFSNVYTAQNKEALSAVSFYATGKNTKFDVFLVRNFIDTKSLNNRKFMTSGTLTNAGYYTIDLPQEVILEQGERFAVVVKITTPESKRPIAIEYVADESTQGVDLSDGEGYISLYASLWQSAEETQKCNLCLKVFTDVVDS